MRFSLWHLSLFVIVSLLGIVVLIGLPAPPSGRGGIDRHTGKRIVTPWDFVDEARRLGDARLAAYRLEEVAGVMNAHSDQIFFEALATLRAELSDPERDAEGEQRLIDEAPSRDRLARRLLAELCNDEAIAEETDRFFSVLDVSSVDRDAPDALARSVIRDEAQGLTGRKRSRLFASRAAFPSSRATTRNSALALARTRA